MVAPKKFGAALRKLLLEKRIASHKKILHPGNIRVFHEKYAREKENKKLEGTGEGRGRRRKTFKGASRVSIWPRLIMVADSNAR